MADRIFLEVKSLPAGDDGAFEGVLSTYGNVDEVGDVCEPGCFDNSVRMKSRFPLLWQHEQSEPIGSFEVVDTVQSLRVKGRINVATSRGRDAHALLKAGDIRGLSIGYVAVKADYDAEGIRHLREVELIEGSLVTLPANPLAMAEAKAKGGIKMQTKSRYEGLKSLADLTEEQRLAILAELDAMDKAEAEVNETPADDETKVDVPAEDVDESELLVRLAKVEAMCDSLAKSFEGDEQVIE